MANLNDRQDQPCGGVIRILMPVNATDGVVKDVFIEQESVSHAVGFLRTSRYSVSSSRL